MYGIKVVSEIEFAAQYTAAKIIGITGSNGKNHHNFIGASPIERGWF